MMTVKLCPSAVQIDNAPKVRCSATRGEEPGIELSPLDIEPSKLSPGHSVSRSPPGGLSVSLVPREALFSDKPGV
jgi:hypothetical protein